MFDLNEVPDGEGPAGKGALVYASAPAAGKVSKAGAECDDDLDVAFVAAEEEEEEEDGEEKGLYSRNEKRTNVLCQLLPDGKVVKAKELTKSLLRLESSSSACYANELTKSKELSKSFLRLDSSSSTCYANDWQSLEVADFDESETYVDNEVTVAALDAHAILDSDCVRGLDSPISLVEPSTPSGISPLLEKLGQRTEGSRKRPDFSSIHRLSGKWDHFVTDKRSGVRHGGGMKHGGEFHLDSRRMSLYPAFVSTRKGKRARDEGGHESPDMVSRVKRYSRLTSNLTGPRTYLGAGPSLSMGFDQDNAAKTSPSVVLSQSSSKLSVETIQPSLSLGESFLDEIDLTGVSAPKAPESKIRSSKIMSARSNTEERAGDYPDQVDEVVEGAQGIEIPDTGSDRKVEVIDSEVKAIEDAITEKPFWQGQLCAEGFSATNAAAYCSEDIQSASKLWSLPQVMVLESLVKIEEFLTAIRKVNVVEPLIRLRLQPDLSSSNRQSFCSLVRSLSFQKHRAQAVGMDQNGNGNGAQFMSGLQDESVAWRKGPLGSAGAEYVFVASLVLKQSTETGSKASAKLYLLLDSSCEAVAGLDREVGRKLVEEVEWPGCYQNTLFGFISVSQEAGLVDVSTCAFGVNGLKDGEITVSMEITPSASTQALSKLSQHVLDSRLSKKVDKLSIQGKFAKAAGDDIGKADVDEGTLTDGNMPTRVKDKEACAVDGALDKAAKARNETHSLRYNHAIPQEDDTFNDRDRPRERDRDLRIREREKDKDKDERAINKDVHRYSLRSNGKADLPKRDRLKDRFMERSRERDHHRENLWNTSERWKCGRENIREVSREKQKERSREREKETERERFVRKRDRSPDAEKGKTDKADLMEMSKIVSGERPDRLGEEDEKETWKKSKTTMEESSSIDLLQNAAKTSHVQNAVHPNVNSEELAIEIRAVPLQETEAGRGALTGQISGSVKESLLDVETCQFGGEFEADGAANTGGRKQVLDLHNTTDEPNDPIPVSVFQIPSLAEKVATNAVPRCSRSLSFVKLTNLDSIAYETGGSNVERPIVTEMASKVRPKSNEGNTFRGDAFETRDTNLIALVKECSVDKNVESAAVPEETRLQCSPIVRGDLETRDSADHLEDMSKVSVDIKNGQVPESEVRRADSIGRDLGDATDSGVFIELKQEKISEAGIVDEGQLGRSRLSLSVRVDNLFDGVEGEDKPDDDCFSREQGLPLPCNISGGGKGISTMDRTLSAISGADDYQGNLTAFHSSPGVIGSGIGGVSLGSPGGGKEISCEIVLENCDKETRVWLVSKQNASYLSEEFGVRIASLEEISTAKTDMWPKSNQGPGQVNLRVFLVTEKSTDVNEAKWFMNQGADVLRAVSSRGVFAKCLWYQGPVQRFGGDHAPSIQVIVKRIKGEDGKNLERIQEETGVMIGIVLDANNKKGLVNSSRVIGLRLKCIRKSGFVEATKRVENLLAQVAEQFLKISRTVVAGSQDIALLKLKVDFSNSTSPSSGILTPIQKDVFAAYSPVSPVAATSPLGAFKCKSEEFSSEVAFTALETVPVHPNSSNLLNVSAARASLGELPTESQQLEDDQPDNSAGMAHLETKSSRPLLVSNLPERLSGMMVSEVLEDVLRDKYGIPSSIGGVSDMILSVRLAPEKFFAYVEFASDDIVLEVLKVYADNRFAFCGLKLEMGSTSSLAKLERTFLSGRSPNASIGYAAGIMEPMTISRSRSFRKGQKSDDRHVRVASLHSSTDSEMEVLNLEQRYSNRDGGFRFLRPGDKPKPLFLTELMRNASARSLHFLFEDIIKKYINPSLGKSKGIDTVLDVRYIPSRGCAFIDLATPELVDFMLDLHSRRPEVFHNMKMEIGRRPVALGHGEEELVVKRSSHLGRNTLVEESHSYGTSRRPRRYVTSSSPPPNRRNELALLDQDFVDDYEEDEEDDRQQSLSRKRRSDPERTVYADRLPDNPSEIMIRRIFERVLRDHLSDDQRDVYGEHIITEVRYVPSKFCAFVVFVGQDLTRLVLQLYNQDEEIFENMRLKPHFHSRMEDLYRDDVHERDDGTNRIISRSISIDRRSRRQIEDCQNGYATADIAEYGLRSRSSAAHRAVAATAFKEVDRRRSVYVDRIPERLPEPAMRDLFERALRQSRHVYSSLHSVSQVTFFRDKFDPDKLCAFVELDNEDLVQELLDVYMEDEDGFSGMRVRPAVKYGN